MKKIPIHNGSADEVAQLVQKSYEDMLDTTKTWLDVLAFYPLPQTGTTPKDVIWRKNKARLYRYISPGLKYKRPVLFIYALINRPYILDLMPGMSLIEHLVNSGFDVYMLDWGEFYWEDRNLSYGELVCDYIARAVQKVCMTSGTDDFSLAGYCMGGTMSTMYASLFPEPLIKNLMLLATPIDFSDAGIYSIWLRANNYDADRVVDTMNLVTKSFIDFGVKMSKPLNNYWGTYTRLWKSIDENLPIDSWKALNKWVDDNINFPGEAYRQWTKEIYQENKLAKGEFKIKGRTVDLSKITANLLVMAGSKDHLVLPSQSKIITDLVSSTDKEYHEFDIGHGGLVFGKNAKNDAFPLIADWLARHSQD